MFKLIWNLLALAGLALVAGMIWLVVKTGYGMQDVMNLGNFSNFDGNAATGVAPRQNRQRTTRSTLCE